LLTITNIFRRIAASRSLTPLVDAGSAHVTADVDFANLKRVLEADNKLITFGPVEQGKFLKNMEAEIRLEALLKKCNEDKKESLNLGFDMLVGPEIVDQGNFAIVKLQNGSDCIQHLFL
jgi:NADH dehydrogenase [ubiquinone] 1 alpha subcomplex assembly factor 7